MHLRFKKYISADDSVQDAGETEKAIFMYGNCTENGKMLTISRLTETEIMAYVFGKLTENGKN